MDESKIQHAIGSTARALGKEMTGGGGEKGTRGLVDWPEVDRVLEDWPDISRKAARATLEKYGPPNEATPSLLIWYDNAPWKRTIVYRDEVPHNFPKPHTDVLEQFVDYRVPVDKYDDIAAFDGSVIPERTKGELSARCDMEEMNYLALNLGHEVATGVKTVEEAREAYAQQATAFMMGRDAPYTQGLRFEPGDGTADLDETTMGPMMKEMVSPKGS
ncbi:MAG: hypothetical protein ABR527_07970 [Gemmatimonadota bacterium]